MVLESLNQNLNVKKIILENNSSSFEFKFDPSQAVSKEDWNAILEYPTQNANPQHTYKKDKIGIATYCAILFPERKKEIATKLVKPEDADFAIGNLVFSQIFFSDFTQTISESQRRETLTAKNGSDLFPRHEAAYVEHFLKYGYVDDDVFRMKEDRNILKDDYQLTNTAVKIAAIKLIYPEKMSDIHATSEIKKNMYNNLNRLKKWGSWEGFMFNLLCMTIISAEDIKFTESGIKLDNQKILFTSNLHLPIQRSF